VASIRASGAYNSPEIAQAAQNIAQMFGPPSASELAGYSTARRNNQATELQAQLAEMAIAQDFDQAQFDRMGMAVGNWVPTQSFRKVNVDDATTRRGQDISAQTSITNNRLDNQTDFITKAFSTLAPGEIRPAIPEDISGNWNLPPIPAMAGAPKPLTESEWTAQQGQRLVDAGKITDDDLVAHIASVAPPPVPSSYDQMMALVTGEDAFGQQYPAANESFGVGGALAGGINRTLDAIGLGAPYPDVQQTQASFGVLRENLLNDIAETYGRQPPSWLLQEIRNLTPEAGNFFEGPDAAQAKLAAIGRQLQSQIVATQEAMNGRNSVTDQQELQTRLGGLQTGLSRVQEALAAFGPQGGEQPRAPAAEEVPEGIDPADWQYMTEAERALFR